MYVPPLHEETDPAVLQALVRAHPLGAWVVPADDGLVANHVPFLLRPGGAGPVLVGHVARANPVWRLLPAARESIVVFQGAEGYVTPSWYPSKQAHGKVVPTWNYAVVHAHGVARAIDDEGWLLALVNELTDTHEAPRARPWGVGDAPREFIDQLVRAIVGIEIPVARMVGKWKVSQNRPAADRVGVVAGLQAEGDAASQAMAALVASASAPTRGP